MPGPGVDEDEAEDDDQVAEKRFDRFYLTFRLWIVVTVGLALFGITYAGGNCMLGPPFCVERPGFSLTSGDLMQRLGSWALVASGLLFAVPVVSLFVLARVRRRRARASRLQRAPVRST